MPPTHRHNPKTMPFILLQCSVILPSLPCIIITIPHHSKAPLMANHPNIELPHHSEAPSWYAYQSLMKWCDWHKYLSSYDNYSHGNYRPHLLRLLQCPDLELPLPQVYTSVWQLQLRNPQLNSTSWSTHHTIKPQGYHLYMAMLKSCCYFRITDSICLLWLLQSQGLTALLRLQWIFYL